MGKGSHKSIAMILCTIQKNSPNKAIHCDGIIILFGGFG